MNTSTTLKNASKVSNIGKAPKKRKCWRPPRKGKERMNFSANEV